MNRRFNTLEYLEWDSDFFGYPVGRVVFDDDGLASVDMVFLEIKSSRYRLVYLFASPSVNPLNVKITDKGGVLTDQKVVFSKITEPHLTFKNVVKEYEFNTPSVRVVKLGLIAGQFSRFRLDKNFMNREFEKLYTRWITDSVSQKIALKTLVALSGQETTGIITLGEKDGYADIGLVAVDSRFSGIGIGTDLVQYAENFAYNLNFNTIKVVTQLQNRPACNLYEKCNFKSESITNVYHFWNRDQLI